MSLHNSIKWYEFCDLCNKFNIERHVSLYAARILYVYFLFAVFIASILN